MSKSPVQKIVMRNGAAHVQTYWQADEPQKKTPSAFRGQQMALPGFTSPPKVYDRNDEVLENSWSTHLGNNPKHSDVVQEFIRAGMSPSAAEVLTDDLSRKLGYSVSDDEIIDHMYEHDLIDQPAPRGGWIATYTLDQRKHWQQSGVPVETAIRWIDSGFPQPWSGIPEMIAAGVSPARARDWQNELRGYQSSWSSDGAYLGMYIREISSEMSSHDAAEWRKAISNGGSPLTDRDMEMYHAGFTAAEAGRWVAVIHDDVTMAAVTKLKDQKWSPTSIKSAIAAMRKAARGHGAGKLSSSTAKELHLAADRLGVKKAVQWVGTLSNLDDFSDAALDRVEASEALKERLLAESGLKIEPVFNDELYDMAQPAQEVLLEMAGMGMSTGTAWEQRALITTAQHIGSPGKLKLLRDGGYRLTRDKDDSPRSLSETAYSRPLDIDTATQQEVNRWLRDTATTIYANRPFELKRWVDDDRVDPVQFKNLLEANPGISNTQLEAVLLHDVSASIADGWL